MSYYSQFSKGGFQALLRLATPDGGMDAVAFGSRKHLVIAVTAVLDGRREIVGIDLRPLPRGLKLSEWPGGDYAPNHITVRLMRTLEVFEEFPEDELHPVSAEQLRGIPLTTILAFRAEEARQAARRSAIVRSGKFRRLGSLGTPMSDEDLVRTLGSNDLSPGDEARLAYLDDALLYVEALREGAKPAEVIEEARGISKRTAEGRIAKARALGLLTAAVGRTASGELTEDAVRLKEWRDRVERARKDKNDG